MGLVHWWPIPTREPRGERPIMERLPTDDEQIQRLFDESRDPSEQVREDDWHPAPGTPWQELDWCQTVGTRRTWYLNLKEHGEI